MALVAASWMAVQGALARLNSSGNKGYEQFPLPKIWRRFVVLWLIGTPLLLAAGSLALSWGTSLISPLSWPFCLMSPTTMWFAPRFEQSLGSPAFYGAATLHLFLSLGLWMRARTLRAPTVPVTKKLIKARQKTIAALQALARAKQTPDFVRPTVSSQSSDVAPINTPQNAALRAATRLPIPTPTPEQERFLNRFTRFDNALLRLELRRAMGKIEWASSAREGAQVGVGLVVFFSILFPAIVVGSRLLLGAPGPRAGSLTFTDMEWMFCAAAMLGLFLTCVDVGQKTPMLYDLDRLDGSLDFLFLTPLETRAIVAGKIVPALVRGACLATAFWPALFTISILLSLGGDFRLWPFALLLPPLFWAFTARAVAWLHLIGVAKSNSKFAYFAAHLGLFAFPVLAAIGVICAAPDGPPTNWELPVALLGLLLIPLCLLDCLWPHAWSVRLLERERVRR